METTNEPQLPTNQPPGSDSKPPVAESPVKPASPLTADTPEVLNEETSAEEESQLPTCESGGQDLKQATAESEAVTQKMGTESEREEVMETTVVGSKEISETETKDTATPGASKAVDTNMNLKSAPENTNVLKLEKEIHNEYFQAPPLGQTLTLQAHKSKDLERKTLFPLAVREDTNTQSEGKSEVTKKSETTEATVYDFAETKKAAEITFEKPGSNSPVRQVLNALQSASRGSLSLSSHSRQSPDTADSDDSPSALEMEDILTGITCVTSEDIQPRPLVGLAAPPVSLAQKEKLAAEDLDHHLDTACNTSPEGTDLGLSEEEPEMDNVLAEPESAEGRGVTKYEESSEEQTYSVSFHTSYE